MQALFAFGFFCVVTDVHPHRVLGILAEPVRTFDIFFFKETDNKVLYVALFYFLHGLFVALPVYFFLSSEKSYYIFFIIIIEVSLFLFVGKIRLEQITLESLFLSSRKEKKAGNKKMFNRKMLNKKGVLMLSHTGLESTPKSFVSINKRNVDPLDLLKKVTTNLSSHAAAHSKNPRPMMETISRVIRTPDNPLFPSDSPSQIDCNEELKRSLLNNTSDEVLRIIEFSKARNITPNPGELEFIMKAFDKNPTLNSLCEEELKVEGRNTLSYAQLEKDHNDYHRNSSEWMWKAGILFGPTAGLLVVNKNKKQLEDQKKKFEEEAKIQREKYEQLSEQKEQLSEQYKAGLRQIEKLKEDSVRNDPVPYVSS